MKRKPAQQIRTEQGERAKGKLIANEMFHEKAITEDRVKVILFPVLLFAAMTLQTGTMSVFLAGLAVVLSLPLGKKVLSNFRSRLCVSVAGLLLFALMQGLAAIYSPFGMTALAEYYKVIAAISLAVILLARYEKKHVPGLLWGFAVVSALISLLCIDASCHGGFYQAFSGAIDALGGALVVEQEIYTTRVPGIYNDANVSASILGLGALLSMYLAKTDTRRMRRFWACILLGISAQGFILSMSRGAILCFALALLVWLLAGEKEDKFLLFCLMAASVGVTIGLSIAAVPAIGTGSMLPVVLTVASGLIIFGLYEVVGVRVADVLQGHSKGMTAATVALGVLCVGYVVAAFVVTGPLTINATGVSLRTIDLAPGDYTLSGIWEGTVNVSVISQDTRQILNSTADTLYSGPLEEASFTVPADRKISIQFWAEEGTTIHTLRASDGTKVLLGQPLLPSLVTDRLQEGLFSGAGYILRAQYMKDAWTLFASSPLIGRGLGSTQELYSSVQSFRYETKYAHSHILQYLSDTGLLGTVPFLAFALGGAWMMLRRLRRERDTLAGVLLACWVMLHLHSLMEINFSIRGYLCFALCLQVLPVLLYCEPVSRKKVREVGGCALAVAFCLYLTVFAAFLVSKRAVDREMAVFSPTSVSNYMDTMKEAARRDVFAPEQMKLNYVANMAATEEGDYDETMYRFAADLRATGTYTNCSGLARYYYLPRGEYEEMFACSREGITQVASRNDGWNLQLNFYRTDVLQTIAPEDMEAYIEGVMALRDYLEEYGESYQDEIVLSNENSAFLETVAIYAETGAPAEGLYPLLLAGV